VIRRFKLWLLDRWVMELQPRYLKQRSFKCPNCGFQSSDVVRMLRIIKGQQIDREPLMELDFEGKKPLAMSDNPSSLKHGASSRTSCLCGFEGEDVNGLLTHLEENKPEEEITQ